jgi:ATP-dependent protease ClpP protease subunit
MPCITIKSLRQWTLQIWPYIIEERQLNISLIDVFSRLMMDRIIFLGTGIDDQIANIVQAQLFS